MLNAIEIYLTKRGNQTCWLPGVKLINMALEYGMQNKFSVFNTFIGGKQAVICLVEAPEDIIDIFKEESKN